MHCTLISQSVIDLTTTASFHFFFRKTVNALKVCYICYRYLVKSVIRPTGILL